MFNTVFIASLLGVLGVIFAHFMFLFFVKKQRLGMPALPKIPMNLKGIIANALKIIHILVVLAVFVLVVVLFLTGFFNPLLKNEHISGYLLMLHVPASGAFAFLFALYLIFSAEKMKFCFPNIQQNDSEATEMPKYQLHKVCFWLLSVLFLPLLLSILLSMFKLFGTEAQEFLMSLHKITAMGFSLIGVLYLYGLLLLNVHHK